MATMSLSELPRVVFEADDGEGGAFAVAIAPGDAVIVQFACSDARLRSYSEARPPSVSMPVDAAAEMAVEMLRQLRPGLVEQLEIAERRAAMRVVRGDGEGDAA